MTGLTSDDVRIEDPDFYFEGREEISARLHGEAPVFYYEPLDVFLLTKHEDIRNVTRHPEIFSSSHGLHLHQLRLTPEETEVYATLYAGEQFAYADPPRHKELRGVASRSFAPRALAQWREQTNAHARQLVGAIVPGQTVEFVDAVAAVLPIKVAEAFIGLPPGHDEEIRSWSDALESMKLIHGADQLREAVAQFKQMGDFFRAQFEVKRKQPGDDLISTLLAAELDGEPLSDSLLLVYCSLFLAGGSDTTRSLLAGMALALAQHPEQLARLRSDRFLLDGAVEESLRWTTPARGFMRTVMHDTEIRGVAIRAGQRVYLLFDAGNRDPDVFENPWTYDITRPNAAQHLSFGYGPHLCIAAHLARMEARVLFDALLDRFSCVEQAGPPQEIRQLLRQGWHSLPLTFGDSSGTEGPS
jgi:cytochrome P450